MPVQLIPAGYLLWCAIPGARWVAPQDTATTQGRAQLATNAGATESDLLPHLTAPVIAWEKADDWVPITADGRADAHDSLAVWFVHPDRGQAVEAAIKFADGVRAEAAEICKQQGIAPEVRA
jgi:hypothetical protein